MKYRKGSMSLELVISIVIISSVLFVCLYTPNKLIKEVEFENVVRSFVADIYEYSEKNMNGEREYRLRLGNEYYQITDFKGRILKQVDFGDKGISLSSKSKTVDFNHSYRNANALVGMKVYFY